MKFPIINPVAAPDPEDNTTFCTTLTLSRVKQVLNGGREEPWYNWTAKRQALADWCSMAATGGWAIVWRQGLPFWIARARVRKFATPIGGGHRHRPICYYIFTPINSEFEDVAFAMQWENEHTCRLAQLVKGKL
jgi:hypothetical protein